MASNNFKLLLTLVSFIRITLGQFGGLGVGSFCSTNLNCGGNTICFGQHCVCPYDYQQFGLSCIYGGSPPPVYIGHQAFGGLDGYVNTMDVGTMLLIQPGGSCSGGVGRGYCGGGSSCSNGFCTCPQSTILSGTYCQPIYTVYPGDACHTYSRCGGGSFCVNSVCQCPFGFVRGSDGCTMGNFVGYPELHYGAHAFDSFGGFAGGIIPTFIYPGQYCGEHISGSCGGGSFCNQGYCVCPPSYIVQNSQCVQYGGWVNNFGAVDFGSYQPRGPIGKFCNEQNPCGYHAHCVSSLCQCVSGYYPLNGHCYRKKLRRGDTEQR